MRSESLITISQLRKKLQIEVLLLNFMYEHIVNICIKWYLNKPGGPPLVLFWVLLFIEKKDEEKMCK